MFRFIELWDAILFGVYNFLYGLKYMFVDHWLYRKELAVNQDLKDKYQGERCFVVLNGPSIRNYDLELLKDEHVICTNFLFQTEYYKVVKPSFHCFIDSDWSRGTLLDKAKKAIDDSEGIQYIVNRKLYKQLDESQRIKCNMVYTNNFPSVRKVRFNMAGRMSALNNVGLFAIQAAMYMGFEKIYVIGLDFAPGPVECCYTPVKEEEYGIEVYRKNSRRELCSFHWYYYFCQLCSFYLSDEARRNGHKIINLNKDSWIRSFDFGKYEDIFK